MIRCRAPPGVDNTSSIVIDVVWGRGELPGFLYQPNIPCFTVPPFDERLTAPTRRLFLDQLTLGLWIGLLLGLVGVTLFGLVSYWQMGRSLDVMFKTLFPSSHFNWRTQLFSWWGSPAGSNRQGPGQGGAPGARPPRTTSQADDGSYIGSDLQQPKGHPRLAPLEGGAGHNKKRRNTAEVLLAKQKKMEGEKEDDDLARFLDEMGLSTGEWKPPVRRDSDASFKEMVATLDAEGKVRDEKIKAAEELKAYRKKHNLDRDGNPILKG